MKLLLFLKIILFFLLLSACTDVPVSSESSKVSIVESNTARYRAKAEEARKFCKARNLDQDFFILIDLSVHSGLKRFFIWDFQKDTVTDSFLVSHGCCNNPWSSDWSKDKALTSNVDGSHCSSIGKYIIGERGYSSWGIHIKYLLHGLEASNNNALKRQIVLHSWERVSDEEVYPSGTAEGWGCPAISNNAMRIVDNKLKRSGKKVLMWIVQD